MNYKIIFHRILIFIIVNYQVVICRKSNQLSKFSSTWSYIGPFIIGKTEIDADPLAAFNCNVTSILRRVNGCPTKFFSDIVKKGYITWSKLGVVESNPSNHIVTIQHPHIDYNTLIQGMSKITILEFQGWVTNKFTVSSDGDYKLDCSPIHSYYVDNVLYLADIYSQSISSTILFLNEGSHYLDIHVRAKGNLQFQCSISKIQSDKLKLGDQSFSSRGSESTDLIEGHLPFNSHSWMQLPITNLDTSSWIKDLAISIYNSKNNKVDNTNLPKVEIVIEKNTTHVNEFDKLAPGHTQYFPFRFSLNSKSLINKNWWKKFNDHDPCFSFSVVVSGVVDDEVVTSNPSTIKLTCRNAKQSFIFTFPDHDGSISHAAAIQPRVKNTDDSSNYSVNGYPVLLALSGVGVSTRSQADSYKYKTNTYDKDYTFGFDNIWILAPTRDGAHNWEGTGYWTIGYITKDKDRNDFVANVDRVVVAGHSRGGHGALTMSTHLPDRFLAVATASGYADRENYGDANILFDLDPQLSYMDPMLLAVHLSTISEHDNSQSAANLVGKDVLVRSGSDDRTVNPFFQRQIARVLTAEGINVTYSEKVGADHWYWDFDTNEDGGVVFDPMTRKFISSHLDYNYKKIELKHFSVISLNPATFESNNGIAIRSVINRLKKSIINVDLVENNNYCDSINSNNNCDVNIPSCYWNIKPFNVDSFVIKSLFWDGKESDCQNIKIHNKVFNNMDNNNNKNDNYYCLDNTTSNEWVLCSIDKVIRQPYNYGPARQAFQSSFLIIVGTNGNNDINNFHLLNYAKYISTGHLHASSTSAPIVLDTDIDTSNNDFSNKNIILVGGPDVNKVSNIMFDTSLPSSFPIKYNNNSVFFGSYLLPKSSGVMFTFPLDYANINNNNNNRNRIGLMISSDSIEGYNDVISHSFSCNTPLTRAPYTNMYADYFITSSEKKKKGLGGLLAHGYWNNNWEISDSNGWILENC